MQAFYEHFSGKEDAFLVAYEVGHRRALVAFERGFESQQDWPSAIHAALQALFSFFAAEPSFAHCALVDAPSASERAAALLVQGIAAYVPMFAAGFDEASPNRPATDLSEGDPSRCRALLRPRRHRKGAASSLTWCPRRTFIALAPFIGGKLPPRSQAPARAPSNGDGKEGIRRQATQALVVDVDVDDRPDLHPAEDRGCVFDRHAQAAVACRPCRHFR